MKWNDLSMTDRATLILLGVASGIYDIGTIKDTYNSYAEGGDLNYVSWINQLASSWNTSPEELSIRDHYDYQKYYNDNPKEAWRQLKSIKKGKGGHFPDNGKSGMYKTENHPTYPEMGYSWNRKENVFFPSKRQLEMDNPEIPFSESNTDRILDYLGRDLKYHNGSAKAVYNNGYILPTVYVTPEENYTLLKRNKLDTGWQYEGDNEFAKGGNLFGPGGNLDEDSLQVDVGGYPMNTRANRTAIYHRYDPTGGYGFGSAIMNFLTGGNHAKGEENEYWKAYVGLPNSVPRMNDNAYTEWDKQIELLKIDNGELTSDFYGTTPDMDLYILAMADTLNLGKLARDYKNNLDIADKLGVHRLKYAEDLYNAAKNVMDNPGKWQLMDEDPMVLDVNPDTNEFKPLGMLRLYGMKWVPEEGALYMHDTYNFPWLQLLFVGKRPREMKIRSRINFNPKEGSKLLRK